LLFGFDTGVISGAILFIKGAFGLAPFTEELLVSAALIGAVCGSILSGRVTDSIGRKRTILITAVIFFLASILSALAPSVGAFIVGRIAIGVARHKPALRTTAVGPRSHLKVYRLAV
jgi:MFS family permease